MASRKAAKRAGSGDAPACRTRAGRRCLLLPGDVTESTFCREAVERTVREHGALDILVDDAAFQRNVASLEGLDEVQWERTIRTNIFGFFHMAKAALPHLREGAAIVNSGSITELEGSKDLLDHSATRGAIHAFTTSLAQNLAERKIRVRGDRAGVRVLRFERRFGRRRGRGAHASRWRCDGGVTPS